MANKLDATKEKGWAIVIAQRVINAWAILGGLALLAVVLMNGISVVGAAFGKPFPGDFELTQVGVAIAVFAFLPYCQLSGANVTADIFTDGASDRTVAIFKLLGALVALGFSALLLWRMSVGMLDQLNYGYTTSILRFPHWIAYAINLVSLALLSIAALLTGIDYLSETRKTN